MRLLALPVLGLLWSAPAWAQQDPSAAAGAQEDPSAAAGAHGETTTPAPPSPATPEGTSPAPPVATPPAAATPDAVPAQSAPTEGLEERPYEAVEATPASRSPLSIWMPALLKAAGLYGAGVCGSLLCAAAPLALGGASLGILAVGVGELARTGGCGGLLVFVFAVIFAVVLGIPAALTIGPTSSLGAAVGAGGAALLLSRPFWLAFLGAIPAGLLGMTMGLGGTLVMLAGFQYSRSNTEPLPWEPSGTTSVQPGVTVFLAGLALALLAGPFTVLAAGSAGGAWFLGGAAVETAKAR